MTKEAQKNEETSASKQKIEAEAIEPEILEATPLEEALAEEFSAFSSWSRAALAGRGIFAIIFGGMLIYRPMVSLLIITLIIGVFLMADAMFLIVGAFTRKLRGWNMFFALIYGLLILFLGLSTVHWPLQMDVIYIIIIGIWQLVAGVNMLTADFSFKKTGWIRFSGVLSIVTGIIFVVWSVAALLAYVWISGIFLVASGISLVIAALFRAKLS